MDAQQSLSGGQGEPSTKRRRVVVRRPTAKLDFQRLENRIGLQHVHDTFLDAFRKSSKGPGHEVEDLGLIIGLYDAWHKRIFNFCDLDQFLSKMDKLGKSGGVQFLVRQWREDISRGAKLSTNVTCETFQPTSPGQEAPTHDNTVIDGNFLQEDRHFDCAAVSDHNSEVSDESPNFDFLDRLHDQLDEVLDDRQ